MALHCNVCEKEFSRSDNLQRHMESIHNNVKKNLPPTPSMTGEGLPPMNDPATYHHVTFMHPFTMLVCGMTGSGKTWWVKSILEKDLIQPPPRPIIWLYGQWQATYDDMKKNIPHLHFHQGLPTNMSPDSFPEGALVVIDDLMESACDSQNVCELFTKGSHHRRLSVVCLLQNLFYQGKQSRTMSLNSQYMVLFKNPRDQQQIMVLARQMFPHNPQHLLDAYRNATARPHGSLVIDLKQGTPEDQRLRPGSLNKSQSPNWWMHDQYGGRSSADEKIPSAHASVFSDTNLRSKRPPPPGLPNTNNKRILLEGMTGRGMLESETSVACDHCGALYDDDFDLEKHMDTCSSQKEKTEEDLNDNKAYIYFINESYKDTNDEFVKRVESYKGGGMKETEARAKVDDEMHHKYKQRFFYHYSKFLKVYKALEMSKTNRKMLRYIDTIMEELDYNAKSAIKLALKRKGYMFNELFVSEDSEEDSSDEDSDNGESSGEDSGESEEDNEEGSEEDSEEDSDSVEDSDKDSLEGDSD